MAANQQKPDSVPPADETPSKERVEELREEIKNRVPEEFEHTTFPEGARARDKHAEGINETDHEGGEDPRLDDPK